MPFGMAVACEPKYPRDAGQKSGYDEPDRGVAGRASKRARDTASGGKISTATEDGQDDSDCHERQGNKLAHNKAFSANCVP